MKRCSRSVLAAVLSLLLLVSLTACDNIAGLSTRFSANIATIPPQDAAPSAELPQPALSPVTIPPGQPPQSHDPTGYAADAPTGYTAEVPAGFAVEIPAGYAVEIPAGYAPEIPEGLAAEAPAGPSENADAVMSEVSQRRSAPARVAVRSVSIDPGSKEIVCGATIMPNVIILPADASDKSFSLSSSDESVLRLQGGLWTAVGAGTAQLVATASNGITGSATITVIVPVTVPVANISISTDKRRYTVGELCSVAVQISPQDATDKTFDISVDGASVTFFSENSFFCDAGGEMTITVTAANGVTGKLSVTVVDLASFAREAVRLTNIERANNGLPPLSEDPALTRTAVVRANEIVLLFSHERPDGTRCFTAFDENGVNYGWAGENIGMGQTTPAEVVRAWMDSPGHRENILKEEFSHIGIGVAMDNNGKLYWAQNFTD